MLEDDYHVLKYHDIQYYHDNAFRMVFVYFSCQIRPISAKPIAST